MQFELSPELQTFRSEVRQFIQAQLPPGWGSGPEETFTPEAVAVTRAFQKAMAKRKWLTMAWPEAYGGLGASPWRQFVLQDELVYTRAPSMNMGVAWVGPTLMIVGSEAQKREVLPPIASGDAWWCTLYSEPGAGSDLASLQTRALQDGDDYIINGQKIWTTGGHVADWGWLAARTDPDVPKHKGITLFLVDMHSPGVTVRPIIDITNGHRVNEVFFEDVRIPKKNVAGEVNRGWYHVALALDFERASIAVTGGLRRSLEEIVDLARAHPALVRNRPAIRQELADRWIELQVGTYLGMRLIDLASRNIVANYEASVAKMFNTELLQRITRTGLHLLGLHGPLWPTEPRAFLGGALAERYLGDVPATIGGGSSEVNRNIIATRGLGLPRG